MQPLTNWVPQDADWVNKTHPDFFHHPLPSFARRCELQIGEVAKIVVQVNDCDDASAYYQRWLTINQVIRGEFPEYVGDLMSGPNGKGNPCGRLPPNGSTTIRFGPQSVYRMLNCLDLLKEDGVLWKHQGDHMTQAEGRWRWDSDKGLVPDRRQSDH